MADLSQAGSATAALLILSFSIPSSSTFVTQDGFVDLTM